MIFLYIIVGLLGGVLSGMGMGGGTILIPLLISFFGLIQKQAQFLNIFSFIFMSFFVVFINVKNKLVDVFQSVLFALPGVLASFCSSFLVSIISENLLKILFGSFLICLASVQIFLLIKNKKN